MIIVIDLILGSETMEIALKRRKGSNSCEHEVIIFPCSSHLDHSQAARLPCRPHHLVLQAEVSRLSDGHRDPIDGASLAFGSIYTRRGSVVMSVTNVYSEVVQVQVQASFLRKCTCAHCADGTSTASILP